MFLCGACHKTQCPSEHCMISYGPCEQCGKTTECSDCVATHPLTRAEKAREREKESAWRQAMIRSYRNTERIEYPARRRSGRKR